MKKLFTTILACLAVTCVMAQGWPANYGGVMLQGFYWDYYDDENWGTWNALEGQANDLEGYIDLIWVPNSGQAKSDTWNIEGHNRDMGYMPCYWLKHNTCFGTEDELKSMISTYNYKGIGIIEDVVINHKNGLSNWCDFPNETKGTYSLNWTLDDICYNDNGGACIANGYNVSGAADTGDDFDGCRDLDHTGANVQKNVKTYLDFLQKELGYAGFRYDMVKGYGPQYVGIYNAYAKPTFSVGEYWDDWGGTTWWVNGTKQNDIVQSAAFDFPLKFLINNAFKGDFNQSALYTQGMAGDNFFKRYSVTFVDNHDTYRDGTCMSNENNVLAANAFILSMPGTPCIFLPHWKTYTEALKRMIRARKAAGITNQSTFTTDICNDGKGRQFTVNGRVVENETGNETLKILLLLGDCGYEPSTEHYRSVWYGNNFKMYVSQTVPESDLGNDARPSGSNANLGTARVDKPSGTYYQEVSVNVSPSDPFTTLVYSTDGSTPSIYSNTIPTSGKDFVFDQTKTLKVGICDGTTVRDIQTYAYAITNEEINDITIYVRADKDPLYLYAWDANGTLTDPWPGTQLSVKKSVNGVNFYCKTFEKSSADYKLNYILSQGSDATKTPDQTDIRSTIFTALNNGSAENLTATYTGYPVEEPLDKPNLITVYVEANRYPLNLYAWDGVGAKLLGDFPGKHLNHTTCINGKTWFYETLESLSPINLIVSGDKVDNNRPQSANFTGVNGDVYVSYDGNDGSVLTNKTADYAGYPHAWYEQGEICAFFTKDNNDWSGIYAWVWSEKEGSYNYSNNNTGSPNWPGNNITEDGYLGYNEYGQKLYKWTYSGDRTSYPEKIIFSAGDNNNEHKTADCNFVNGAWYNATTNLSQQEPVSTAVEPSNVISIADLGTPTPATNWNGESEKVAENNGTNPMTKVFSLEAGDHIVQAIVRGTDDSSVTLSANGKEASVDLTGLDGAPSSVQTNGIVDSYEPGTNNGWQKVEVAFTLSEAAKVTVTLTSAAAQWQLGALKVLPGTTITKASTGTYIDVSAGTGFSFFERGENRNALIKAAAGTLPAQLPYNVIVNGICANLKLTDSDSEHSYSFNNAGENFTAITVSYDRSFGSGTSTICLPFALTAEEVAAAGTFWELESYNATTGIIRFKKVESTKANTPYLFKARTENTQSFLSLANKTIQQTPPSLTVTKYNDEISFVGVNTHTHLVSESNGRTYYGYRSSDKSFVKVGTTGGANINPFRAYLTTPTPPPTDNNARLSVSFDGDSSETGIQVVTPEVEPMKQQSIYNLSGQRVYTPNKKGIYIVGDRKYIVK